MYSDSVSGYSSIAPSTTYSTCTQMCNAPFSCSPLDHSLCIPFPCTTLLENDNLRGLFCLEEDCFVWLLPCFQASPSLFAMAVRLMSIVYQTFGARYLPKSTSKGSSEGAVYSFSVHAFDRLFCLLSSSVMLGDAGLDTNQNITRSARECASAQGPQRIWSAAACVSCVVSSLSIKVAHTPMHIHTHDHNYSFTRYGLLPPSL